MAHFIDLNQPDALDDSELLDSWEQAYAEYLKYHSVHSGQKSLEEVLNEEELEQLQKAQDSEATRLGTNGSSQRPLKRKRHERSVDENVAVCGPDVPPHLAEDEQPNHQEAAASAPARPTPQIPEAMLANVKDQALKNLMMSWYYAGYYTGFYDGQQQQLGA